MIKLFHFMPWHGLPDPSPFCIKVDLYLRATRLEYERRPGFQNMARAPKHKLPFIEDNGKIIPDSAFILAYLKQNYGDPLDKDLNSEQKAITHAFGRMLEENFYWCIVRARWLGEDVWPIIKQDFFGALPLPLKLFIPPRAQKRVRDTLYKQGLGRHSDEEALQIAKKDLTALSDLLGDKDYFLIDKPATLDVIAYAFLSEVILTDISCSLNDTARSFDNLVAFVTRMKEMYYTD